MRDNVRAGLLAVVITIFAIVLGLVCVKLLINARDCCFPWSPRQLPFHPGMTLCPGQSTTLTIMVPVPDLEPPKPPAVPERTTRGI